jgi:glycosyltransferase involved in cell wall biosynthesis
MRLLTVGIPVYNAMPFLPEAVESVLRQTYPDFDLLVVDDGSTDGGPDYLRSVSDPRVRVIRQENRGMSNALNRMLREINTPWLVRQDADDLADEHRLEVIIQHINQYPSAGMFYSHATYHGLGPDRVLFRSTIGTPEVLRNVTRAGYTLAICHPTAVLHAEKTLRLGGYRPALRAAQDADLWWRIALSHDIRFIPQTTLAYRLTLSGLSTANFLLQAKESLYAQYMLLSSLWALDPKPFDQVEECLRSMVDLQRLHYRDHLRRCGMAWGDRQWLQFLGHAVAAAWISPAGLLERVRYRPDGAKLTVNGVNPLLFARRSDELWPLA